MCCTCKPLFHFVYFDCWSIDRSIKDWDDGMSYFGLRDCKRTFFLSVHPSVRSTEISWSDGHIFPDARTQIQSPTVRTWIWAWTVRTEIQLQIVRSSEAKFEFGHPSGHGRSISVLSWCRIYFLTWKRNSPNHQ